MISESDDNWFQSTHIFLGGEYHPLYIEYMNLRHRLGLEPDIDKSKPPLHDGKVRFHFKKDGKEIRDEGELAETNRAMWCKFIEEHRDDDNIDNLI